MKKKSKSRTWKITTYTLTFIAGFIACFIFLALLSFFIDEIPEKNFFSIKGNYSGNFTLNLINLTENETKIVYYIISNTKPIYKSLVKNLTFVKTEGSYEHLKKGELGVNFENGENIYVRYSSNTCKLMKLFCHELLHSFSQIQGEREEEIVDDIENYYVCFKKNVCEK